MSTRLRNALMWVLVAALPLQSVAAATMLHCGSLPNSAAHAHEDADRPAHAHDDHAMGGHHGHHAVANASEETTASPSGAVAPSTQGQDGGHTLLHDAKGKCSACASCCTAAALPSAIQSFDATPPTYFFAPSAPLVTPVFITAGPERPPRLLFA